jgi:diguanylate cyclase (GGDEF)-like protein
MSRRQQSIAVLFLDLDEFKPINDNFGHDAGDRLLVSLGRRLQSCLRPEDTIARLGGDEFTVLLEDITDVRYAIRVAERIAESLRSPFKLDGHEAKVTASIGIAVSTGQESTPEELLRNSDRAMYQAKYGGKARHVVYNETITTNGAEAEAETAEPQAVEHADVLGDELDEELAEGTEEVAVAEEQVGADDEPASVEGIGLFQRTQEPESFEEDEAAEPAVEQAADAQDIPAGSALSEARRRRRMRFPPR